METKKPTGYPSIDKPWLKYYSEEAINAPLPECTIYEYLWNSNQDNLANTALNYYDHKISYGELFAHIEAAAKAFLAIGIRKGDIVVMAAVTIPETIYSIYALNRIGAIPNMVDPRTSAEGIREYIAEVQAKYIFTLGIAYPKIAQAAVGMDIAKIIVLSPSDSLTGIKKTLYRLANRDKNQYQENCICWKELIALGQNHELIQVPYEKNACGVIVHTGGTTGMPKAVMLSNDNLNAAAYQSILTGIELKRDQSWLNIMPPFIAYGIGNGLHLPLVLGMETILIPAFEAEKFADYLNKYHPNHMIGVPSHYGNIIDSPKLQKKDLSYIVCPTVGGDTMDKELEQKTNTFLHQHRCNWNISKGYGMTEVSAAVSITISDELNPLGSVGIPFTHTLISIFDIETGQELPYGEQGEVCISSPNTMLGYYNNPAATKEILRTHEDGRIWVHSGDIGYMTEDGFLYILGRIKRMIIRHDGFKVFPTLIENTITAHPAVDLCCVVGIPDKSHSQGQLPKAHIVLKAAHRGREIPVKAELQSLCLKQLPEYAQPAEYCFREDMPLTGIGKIDYKKLEESKDK